jgi:hypothetical protein
MLNDDMLSIVILSIVILSVVILNVVLPYLFLSYLFVAENKENDHQSLSLRKTHIFELLSVFFCYLLLNKILN